MIKALLLTMLLSICSCVTYPKALKPSWAGYKEPRPHEIFVVSHGKHTGLIVDGETLNRRLPHLKRQFGEPRYYEVGWGDAGFYQSPRITSGLAVNAVFIPTPTVVHVVALEQHPREAFALSEVVALKVSTSHREQLLAFIDSSFARDEDGLVGPLGPGLYGDSAFYDAVGNYHLFNTCNKWTAKALYSAGVPVDAVTPISSGDVMKQIRPR